MLRRIWFTGLSALAGLTLGSAAPAGEVVVVPPPAPCPPLVSVKAGDPARPWYRSTSRACCGWIGAHGRLLRRRLGVPVLAPPLVPPPMASVEGELPAPRPLAPTHPPRFRRSRSSEPASDQRAGTHEVTLLHLTVDDPSSSGSTSRVERRRSALIGARSSSTTTERMLRFASSATARSASSTTDPCNPHRPQGTQKCESWRSPRLVADACRRPSLRYAAHPARITKYHRRCP
jgi:hypothetical protein